MLKDIYDKKTDIALSIEDKVKIIADGINDTIRDIDNVRTEDNKIYVQFKNDLADKDLYSIFNPTIQGSLSDKLKYPVNCLYELLIINDNTCIIKL